MHVKINDNSFIVETGTTGHDAFHWSLINDQVWENETFRALEKYLQKDSIYIDIGAHIGMTVLYASTLCKHCHAIDPDPAAFASLQRNLQLNSIENVTCYPVAIGKTEGPRTLTFPQAGNSWSSIAITYEHAVTVECLRLERFIVENKIENVSLIKIDVEGAEAEILERSAVFIKLLGAPVLLSLHPQFFDDKIKFMNEIFNSLNGFDIFSLYDDSLIEKDAFIQIIENTQVLAVPKNSMHCMIDIYKNFLPKSDVSEEYIPKSQVATHYLSRSQLDPTIRKITRKGLAGGIVRWADSLRKRIKGRPRKAAISWERQLRRHARYSRRLVNILGAYAVVATIALCLR